LFEVGKAVQYQGSKGHRGAGFFQNTLAKGVISNRFALIESDGNSDHVVGCFEIMVAASN
jgi:hypothetical protein